MRKEGFIIRNIANQYMVQVKENDKKIDYACNARGKFKKQDISPVVGDRVKIEIADIEKKIAVIEEIENRTTFIKRPKLANCQKLIFVLSTEMPKPDLWLLDKQLVFAEYLHLEPVIVINKIDLDKDKKVDKIKKLYEKIGYPVIQTNAKTGEGIEKLKRYLKGNISAFSGNSGVRKIYLN